MKKVLAVASGGGHWKQLMLISPSFSHYQVKYITTIKGLPEESGIDSFNIVTDSNKNEKFKVILTFLQILKVIVFYRPDLVITTGAAPGLLALAIGRVFLAKTIWIDSIANGEKLSMGGKISRRFAHVVMSQWQEVARQNNVQHKGSVF